MDHLTMKWVWLDGQLMMASSIGLLGIVGALIGETMVLLTLHLEVLVLNNLVHGLMFIIDKSKEGSFDKFYS